MRLMSRCTRASRFPTTIESTERIATTVDHLATFAVPPALHDRGEQPVEHQRARHLRGHREEGHERRRGALVGVRRPGVEGDDAHLEAEARDQHQEAEAGEHRHARRGGQRVRRSPSKRVLPVAP